MPVSKITDVYMGNVMQASVGQSPARQATIFAGLPSSVEAITINKVCASGLKAVVFAAQNIQLGLAEAQIAGGMENMSQVPYYVPRSSSLPAFGHVKMEDGLIKDGLTDVYDQIHMGNCAENSAKKYEITREVQDQYAIQSYERAQAAWKAKAFAEEIAPVTVKGRKGETVIDTDEGFLDVKLEKIPTLKPAFIRDGTGTVTAANSSTLNDGASALVLGSKAIAQEFGAGSRVLARICGSADAAMDPIDFPVAPAKAVPIALERAGITKDQVAIWEFNEAFAAVIKANEKVSSELTASDTTSSTLLTYLFADSGSGGSEGQSTWRRYFAGPCSGELRLKNSHNVATPAQARRVWRGGYLQWWRCGDSLGGSEDRVCVMVFSADRSQAEKLAAIQ